MATTLNVRIDDDLAAALDEIREELSQRLGDEVDKSQAARVAIKKGIEALKSERRTRR